MGSRNRSTTTLAMRDGVQTAPAEPAREAFSILRRRGPWRDALRRRMLALADLVAVAVATTLCVGISDGDALALALGLLPAWLLAGKLHGLYDQDHRVLRHLTVDELPSLVSWATTGSAGYLFLASMLEYASVTPTTALQLWLALIVLATGLRAGARAAWRLVVPPERALLVGSGPLETATLRKLELFEDIHVVCAGVLDDAELGADGEGDAPHGELERHLAEYPDLDRLIVASTNVSEHLIAEHVDVCRRHRLKLSVVPPARGMFGTAVLLHHIADLPMIEYSTWDMPRSNMLLKRCLDVIGAALALVLLSPLMLAIAVAVRLTSRGPALFVQHRAGIGGKPFRMLKFRTMGPDAEHRLADLVALDELPAPMFKLRGDPRVTRIGAFLRRTSLDELPQLLNVLTGSMSLVGPRPEELAMVERYAPEHEFRLSVKPGLTGPMQVYGRGELRFDERLAVEREYVENLSLARDLRLILLTVAPVLRGKGAY
jgi:exopolysaccharide biosynthesis polyprenyl glycosylphosphotransferase